MLIAFAINAQHWTDNLPTEKIKNGEELTFLEIQKAFTDYWAPLNVEDGYYVENGVKKKAAGWKQFKRWEWYWEMRVDPTTGEFPKTSAAEIRKQLNQASDLRNADGNWMSMGPTTAGTSVGLGRLNCIAFVDTDNDRFYVGSPSGGLWRTTDGGGSWTVLTDDNDALGVSDVLVYAGTSAATDTIYIATGDRDGGSMWSLGGGQVHDNNTIGVLKSVDGGTSWTATDLEWLPSDKKTVNRLLKHPTNSDSIYATGSDGVFLTTDGGATWPIIAGTFEFIDMEFKPMDPGILYGSTRLGKVYKSSDKGLTWDLKLDVFGAKRVELAVSEDMPGYVYAVVVASTSGLEGIYKSEDDGETWTKVFDGSVSGHNLLGSACDGSSGGGQGTYDLALAAKPDDAFTLYVGGVNTWKSTDGGSTWGIINHWTGGCGAPTVHADQHWLAFQNATGNLFECNDGGLYTTTDGSLWTNLTDGLIIGQIYRLGVSQSTANNTISGFQDNGTHSMLSGSWEWVISGDGMECFIDYTDDDTQYGSIYFGRIFRTTDGWSSPYTEITTGLSGYAAWVSPFAIDPITHTTIYVARDTVWKSLDQGASWAKISDFATPAYPDDVFRSMAVAPSNPDTIYVAVRSKIWATYDGGTAWSEITGSLPVGSSNITYISVNSDDADTLWVAMGEYNTHGVYQSVDAGTTWTNISSGLPTVPVMCVIQNRLNTSEVELYAATDVGVYVKVGSADWALYSEGLPNVVVTELEIYYDDATPNRSRLRAATFGRGLWESELYAPPGSAPVADFVADNMVPLVDSAVAFTDRSVNDATTWSWSFSPSSVTYLNGTSSASQNPEVSFDASGSYDVALTASNASGSDTETKVAYISVVAPYKWVGTTSTDWNTASNWDSGLVPDETKHVIIEAGATFYPELLGNFYVGSTGGTYNCKSLTIESGGLLTVGAVPVPYFDMLVYGDLTVKTGGTLKTADDLSIESGGKLYILGGSVENFVNTTGGYGDLFFKSGCGGYMTAGSVTVYSDLGLYGGNWYATGGTFHIGGSASSVKILVYDADIFLNDLVIDENVSSYLSSSSSSALTLHGDYTQEAGSMYSISAGETINVLGDVLLKSNASGVASLINSGTMSVSGTSTVQRFVTDAKWSLIASPVAGETVSSLYFSDAPKTWLQKYMEPSNTWEYITTLDTPLTQGHGWSYWVDPATFRSDVTLSFAGSLLASDLTLTSFSYSGDAAHGYNIAGNPFPCAIDWDAGSWDTTDIRGNIWVWDDAGLGDGSGTYIYRNAQGMGSLTDGIIPMAQGFFVQASGSSPSLTIPADARVHSSMAFYEPESEIISPYVVFEVNRSGKKDEVWITFDDGLTEGFDNGWDVNKLFVASGFPQLYISEGEYSLSIDALPVLDENPGFVSLSFRPDENGDYSLSLKDTHKMENIRIVLEDLFTGQFFDVNKGDDAYQFTATAEDRYERFLLHFNPVITGLDESGKQSVPIYAYGKYVYVSGSGFSPFASVFIYDLYGREIVHQNLNPSTMNKIRLNLNNSAIIVKTIDEGRVSIKKLFIH